MKIFLEQLTQNPKTYLNNLCEENRLSQAFLGYSLGIISLYFAIKLNSFTLPTLSSFITTFIFWFICNITANFILAATANLFLDFFGYKSKALGIFILLGISQLIWTLLVPCFFPPY